jgi:hypothetical protein
MVNEMADDTRFGSLDDVALTDAWAHEARDFTPWLAANLERLGKSLGLALELSDTEVAVESFYADILARDLNDGSLVLIENQFQQSDHTHLGQILTYLAGLQARKVVWIAPKFREPHLSAIRWLNEHTEDTFSFFAVELRVIRIGGSPMVPLFDVIERPNGWDRRLQLAAKQTRQSTEIGTFRRAFWNHYELKAGLQETNYGGNTKWQFFREHGLKVSSFLNPDRVGVFIGPAFGVAPDEALATVTPFVSVLEAGLGAPTNGDDPKYLFIKRFMSDMQVEANWDRAAEWLKEQTDLYVQTLTEVLGRAS